jgi:hypothetical protein
VVYLSWTQLVTVLDVLYDVSQVSQCGVSAIVDVVVVEITIQNFANAPVSFTFVTLLETCPVHVVSIFEPGEIYRLNY